MDEPHTTDGGRQRGRPAQLAAFATAQHGCFTDNQADAAGYTRRARERRLTNGVWVRLGPSTFHDATTPVTWRMRLHAGLLELGADALVGLRSAAALYQVEGFPEGPVDLVVPRRLKNRRLDGLHVHTTTHLPQIDRFRCEGLPVTSAARTVIDLARYVTPSQLARLVDGSVRNGFASPEFLRRRLEALRGSGRAGVRALDEVLLDSGGHTFLERAFLKLVREAGLAKPTCQTIFRRDGKHVARVDFSFDPLPVVVEVMGRRGHVSEADRTRDAQRCAELLALGRTVVPFTSQQVFREPAWVLDRLGEILAAAA